jgi:cadaverine:lysine antiporter
VNRLHTPETHKIGVIAASAIVAGNMMGSGIILLPASFASLGSITLVSWILASIGALSLAYIYATLGKRDPQAGGPVAYAAEVAPVFGYQAGLLYFHAGWVGNLAMALSGIAYLSVFFPSLIKPLPASIGAVIAIWVLTALNLLGARWIGRLVTTSVSLLLIPILLVSIFGWFVFEPAIFLANWNVTHQSDSLITIQGIVLSIWAFIGIESASVNAGLVRNPNRTIPLATMLGTAITALVYTLSTTAISGMLPAAKMASTGAPFSLALEYMIEQLAPASISAQTIAKVSIWARNSVSIVAVVACFVSLGAWIMSIAQAASRSANDGALPSVFSQINDKGVPVKGIILLAALCTILMAFIGLLSAFTGKSTKDMFNIIASVTVLFTIIPYFYSALQMIRLERMEHVSFKHAVIPVTLSLVAIVWAFVTLIGVSLGILFSSLVVIFGVLVFYVSKDRTELEKRMHELRIHKIDQLKRGS